MKKISVSIATELELVKWALIGAECARDNCNFIIEMQKNKDVQKGKMITEKEVKEATEQLEDIAKFESSLKEYRDKLSEIQEE